MAAYYRHDGVRITHDPYAPGMADKYGAPGATDGEGFDPYADSVGPGIYGGRIKRDAQGAVEIGRQYQNHNPRPGPIYAGGGYTPINTVLSDVQRLEALLDKYPDLANDVSTGGATPLHMCGMSRGKQNATAVLTSRGADVEALDTYGFTPLHRMASNNLGAGARMLLEAGADPLWKGGCGETPMAVARSSAAKDVIRVLEEFGQRREISIVGVTVTHAGVEAVNGFYEARDASRIPEKFALVCEQNRWDPKETWDNLSGSGVRSAQDSPVVWYEAPNSAYIYFNAPEGQWWIDGPDGLGVYKAIGRADSVPACIRGAAGNHGWYPLDPTHFPVPTLLLHRSGDLGGKTQP
eukprot:TRINITY_DN3170_c0_g1_i1.p1 TRINITY_DN3170_c0_g1~~TRINITY_DN3170_c0_g1_i1.p1  ORF type:complete len:383 (-),score=40.50 TRINITY_DN3170_c0_g1_i1:408-1460(-)